MHFMQIRVRKDGKPVGVLFKKNTSRSKNNGKKRLPRSARPDDIIEITGIRESDNEHDRLNIYRNAQIVNNTLVPYPPNYRPHKMERSNVMKI